jgi:hypothetical protein
VDVAICLLPFNKTSSEKQNVKYSPDGADILPQSRRAREIKARAGQVVLKKWSWVLLKNEKAKLCLKIWLLL